MAKEKAVNKKDYGKLTRENERLTRVVLVQGRLLSKVWKLLHSIKVDVRRLTPSHLPGLIERKIEKFIAEDSFWSDLLAEEMKKDGSKDDEQGIGEGSGD